MTRFLLTLLALLTGLTVSGGSAEARLCAIGDAQVGAVETLAGGDRLAGHDAAVMQPLVRRSGSIGQRPCAKPQLRPVHVSTVELGPDRAHE